MVGGVGLNATGVDNQLLELAITIGPARALALIDSGASHNFISTAFVVRHGLAV